MCLPPLAVELIPIPKDSGKNEIMSVDQFRGITISPVISKLFEHCTLIMYRKHFKSSERQFGFKSKLSCAHAIYAVRKVTEYFVSNDSTVNLCCLDISKAFDRVNCNRLFFKLINMGVPINFILLLRNWYSNTSSCVRWGDTLSDFFPVNHGVRQGGVLSGTLFTIYVDNILNKLNYYGCNMSGLCLGSFMYADDLILLAPSVAELQIMLDICTRELNDIDLRLNVSKSSCIRIGKRCHAECRHIVTADGFIPWSSTVKYLGINIVAGMKFTCSMDNLKANFYSSFNAIYCKLGMFNNLVVTLHLISTIALPCLTYAQEALSLTKTYLKSLERPWSRVFMKLFTTFNDDIIHQCQYFTDCMPLEHTVFLKKFNFLMH